MLKDYKKPSLEIILLDNNDVITTSTCVGKNVSPIPPFPPENNI